MGGLVHAYPTHFLCPIGNTLVMTPVKARCGHIFEQERVIAWLRDGNHNCPVDGSTMQENELTVVHDAARRTNMAARRKYDPARRPSNRKEEEILCCSMCVIL